MHSAMMHATTPALVRVRTHADSHPPTPLGVVAGNLRVTPTTTSLAGVGCGCCNRCVSAPTTPLARVADARLHVAKAALPAERDPSLRGSPLSCHWLSPFGCRSPLGGGPSLCGAPLPLRPRRIDGAHAPSHHRRQRVTPTLAGSASLRSGDELSVAHVARSRRGPDGSDSACGAPRSATLASTRGIEDPQHLKGHVSSSVARQ